MASEFLFLLLVSITTERNELVLKATQVAERLNCSVSTVYGLIESGRLGHHRCPGVRVSEEQLTEYLLATKREQQTERKQETIKRPQLRLRNLKF